MNRDLRLPFDPDFCFKVARAASMVCVAWLAMELTLLIAVQPASGICPGWTIHPGQPSQTKAWFLMLMFTAAPALWICFVVLR